MKQITIAFLGTWLIGFLTGFSVLAQSTTELEYSPEEIGKRVVSHIVEQRIKWRYQRVCAYYGACKFSQAISDDCILKQMEECYTPYLEGKRKPRSGHVDYNVFGIWPFEMSRQTGKKQYLRLAKELVNTHGSGSTICIWSALCRYKPINRRRTKFILIVPRCS
jgi:hypothetical protein